MAAVVGQQQVVEPTFMGIPVQTLRTAVTFVDTLVLSGIQPEDPTIAGILERLEANPGVPWAIVASIPEAEYESGVVAEFKRRQIQTVDGSMFLSTHVKTT